MFLDLAQCSTRQLPLTILLWLATIAAGACCAAIIVLLYKMVFENISKCKIAGDLKCKVF